MRIIFLLFWRQVEDFSRLRAGDLEHVTSNIQVFPTNKNFDCTKFQRFKCVVYSKAVLSGVLTDFVKITPYESTTINPYFF